MLTGIGVLIWKPAIARLLGLSLSELLNISISRIESIRENAS